jgi:hypothetical protein
MKVLQRIYPIVIFTILIIFCGFIAGCTTSSPPTTEPVVSEISAPSPAAGTNSSIERVEVIHFHRTQQCPSCIAVGDLTENTLKANFQKELASGKLVFAHVGYELPENAALTAKYGVTGSSLWIGVYNGSTFHKEQDLKVWYLIDDENTFSTYLSGIITKRLNGDLS